MWHQAKPLLLPSTKSHQHTYLEQLLFVLLSYSATFGTQAVSMDLATTGCAQGQAGRGAGALAIHNS